MEHGVNITLACLLFLLVPQLMAFQLSGFTTPLVIYFDDGPLVSERLVRNGGVFIPAIDLAERLSLPYTNTTDIPALLIRGSLGTVEARHNSNTISIDGEDVQMNWPAFMEDGRWWVPMEFLTLGFSRTTGIRFRYKEAPRVIVGNVAATLFDMNAARTDVGTRLTIRTGSSVNIRLQEDLDRGQVVLAIDRAPLEPTRETLQYSDATVRSVTFDDRDGMSKVIIETVNQETNVNLVSADDNRTFYVNLSSKNIPSGTTTITSSPIRDGQLSGGRVRIIAIDPGHGGLDGGARAHGTLEKDLTMAFAREFQTNLQTRLDATVILTRDGDREVSIEDRASIANNSGASLLISLHVGYSLDPTESSSSLFIMQPISTGGSTAPSSNTLFQPWYHAYESSSEQSRQFAELLHETLDQAFPSWDFPVRLVPMGLLASTTMPAVVLELGNANNEQDLTNLNSMSFRERIVKAVLDAIQAFGNGA